MVHYYRENLSKKDKHGVYIDFTSINVVDVEQYFPKNTKGQQQLDDGGEGETPDNPKDVRVSNYLP